MTDPNTDKPLDANQGDHVWEEGWDGHKLAQLRRLAQMSLPEKLRWLEEAHRLVLQMQALGRDNNSLSPRPKVSGEP